MQQTPPQHQAAHVALKALKWSISGLSLAQCESKNVIRFVQLIMTDLDSLCVARRARHLNLYPDIKPRKYVESIYIPMLLNNIMINEIVYYYYYYSLMVFSFSAKFKSFVWWFIIYSWNSICWISGLGSYLFFDVKNFRRMNVSSIPSPLFSSETIE